MFGLSAYEIAGITAVVSSLVESAASTEITFYTPGARGYDPATGTVSYGETATPLTGWLGPITLEQLERVEGAQAGDVQVLVLAADLATPPATDARFRAGGIDYRVYSATRGPLDTHHLILAQRVK